MYPFLLTAFQIKATIIPEVYGIKQSIQNHACHRFTGQRKILRTTHKIEMLTIHFLICTMVYYCLLYILFNQLLNINLYKTESCGYFCNEISIANFNLNVCSPLCISKAPGGDFKLAGKNSYLSKLKLINRWTRFLHGKKTLNPTLLKVHHWLLGAPKHNRKPK